jgi:uncharacterized alpha-E superfamily protein
MLSRIAESLYWIGRYVERADGTARILDAHVHGSFSGLDPILVDQGCHRLFAVMGVTAPAGDTLLTTADVMRTLGYADTQPSSVAASLLAARENARGVREVISAEMWECLNATYLRLPGERRAAQRRGPDGFLAFIRRRAALFAGYVDSTMSRDDGWRFLVLGRNLERVDMTARLLSSEFSRSHPEASSVLLLRSCGGYEAFLREYRGQITAAGAVHFLVGDPVFPRSLLHALTEAEEVLVGLEPSAGPRGVTGQSRRVVGATRARLAYAAPDALVAELPDVLSEVQAAMVRAHTAVAERFFRQVAPVAWSAEAPA